MDGITVEYPLIKPDELAGQAWAAMGQQNSDEALRLLDPSITVHR